MKIATLILSLFSLNAFASPAQVFIIRHAEKPTDSSPILSPKGEEHAQEFATYFTSCEEALHFGTPVAIYAMAPQREEGSVRAIQTVQPLATKLGITPITSFTKKQYGPMVQEIFGDRSLSGKSVLICWEHKVIRDIVRAMGVKEDPGKWSADDYNTIYRIDFKRDGSVKAFNRLSDLPALSSQP